MTKHKDCIVRMEFNPKDYKNNPSLIIEAFLKYADKKHPNMIKGLYPVSLSRIDSNAELWVVESSIIIKQNINTNG
jgi:hypothetical protein